MSEAESFFAGCVLVMVLAFGAAFMGFAYGTMDARENICKSTFHGEPHDNGAICISKDGKVIARF